LKEGGGLRGEGLWHRGGISDVVLLGAKNVKLNKEREKKTQIKEKQIITLPISK
jgi:hypothetical protein